MTPSLPITFCGGYPLHPLGSAHKPSMLQSTISLHTKDPGHSGLHKPLPQPWIDLLEIIPICLVKFLLWIFLSRTEDCIPLYWLLKVQATNYSKTMNIQFHKIASWWFLQQCMHIWSLETVFSSLCGLERFSLANRLHFFFLELFSLSHFLFSFHKFSADRKLWFL